MLDTRMLWQSFYWVRGLSFISKCQIKDAVSNFGIRLCTLAVGSVSSIHSFHSVGNMQTCCVVRFFCSANEVQQRYHSLIQSTMISHVTSKHQLDFISSVVCTFPLAYKVIQNICAFELVSLNVECWGHLIAHGKIKACMESYMCPWRTFDKWLRCRQCHNQEVKQAIEYFKLWGFILYYCMLYDCSHYYI